MTVMVDLNVLLDVIQQRQPHFAASAQVLARAATGDIKACVPAHAVTTLYYIIRKYADATTADEVVDWVIANADIVPAGKSEFARARALPLDDFEDAVVASLAEAARCAYIVTRNAGDFEDSPVPALAPGELLAAMAEDDGQ